MHKIPVSVKELACFKHEHAYNKKIVVAVFLYVEGAQSYFQLGQKVERANFETKMMEYYISTILKCRNRTELYIEYHDKSLHLYGNLMLN